MAFPTTSILDNFNRADTGPPPSSNWTTGLLGASSGLKVLTNQLKINTTVDGSGYWNVQTFGPDCEIYLKVATIGTGYQNYYLMSRITNPAGAWTCYCFYMDVANGAALYKLTSTGNSLLTSNATVCTNGDVLGISVIGTALVGYKNGTSIISASDGSLTTAGYIGLYIADQNGLARFDDFGGGAIAAATLPVKSVVVSQAVKQASYY